jgi:hypothetical protein
MSYFVSHGTGSRLRDVRILDNTGLQGISLATAGSGGVIEQVSIERNVQRPDSPYALSLVSFGDGATIGDVVIVDNVLMGNVSVRGGQTVAGQTIAARNLVRDVRLERNLVQGVLSVQGGVDDATENTVRASSVRSNHLIGGVDLAGGIVGASGNVIADLTLAGNTIVRADTRAIRVYDDAEAGIGNTVSGVRVINSILSAPLGDFEGKLSVNDVSYTLTSAVGFAGVNGNIAGDPRFVDPSLGDYRLAADSPAIDAGTSVDTPALDQAGCPRFDDPSVPNSGAGAEPFFDLGALERGPCP